jgi:hypothetical protein
MIEELSLQHVPGDDVNVLIGLYLDHSVDLP